MTTPSTDGRVRRASRLREQRRRLILDAAVEVFGRRGYHQTRIQDILEAAGIARGTFYLYFESKSAIFLELLDRLLAHVEANVVGVDTSASAPPVGAQLHRTVIRILDTVADNRALTAIMLREAVGLDAEVDAKLRAFYDSLHALVVESLESGQDMGLIRPMDFDVAATCVVGSIRQILDRELVRRPDRPFDTDRVARGILDFALRGLLAPTRHT